MGRHSKSDFADISYLVRAFPNKVQAVRDRLDSEAVDFFLEAAQRGSREHLKHVFGR